MTFDGQAKPKAAIVGVGLIGGSLGLAWKARGVVSEVIGIARRAETITEAVGVGAIDWGTTSLEEGVSDADIVVIAAPVRSIVPLYRHMQAAVKRGALITDVGSTKAHICDTIWAAGDDSHVFIGGHPMAGSEQEGVSAADPYLFQNAVYVYTPPPGAPESHIALLTALIEATGAHPIAMTPAIHDDIVAAVSHVPHMVAAALVTFAARRNKDVPGLLQLAAGGFRDTTRVASGPEDVWADICLTNADAIAAGISGLESVLADFKQALLARDGARLSMLLGAAREQRESIPAKAKGIMATVFDIVVHVVDRPGAIKEVAGLLGDVSINIIDIEILRVREGEGGTLRLGFERREDMDRALEVLRIEGYKARSRG